MSELQYTSIDTILSRVYRELRGSEINETDVIEWIGEALEFLKVAQIQEEAVTFLKVADYELALPQGFQMLLQVAKYNKELSTKSCIAESIIALKDSIKSPECVDCVQSIIDTPINDSLLDEASMDSLDYTAKWEYVTLTNNHEYQEAFTPIRLADHTFFRSVVCRELDKTIYNSCVDEYTIVGTVNKKLRFSFQSGYVALSYLCNVIDQETGYPLIPDNISYVTAIIYYIKWKMAERLTWSGREGYARLAQAAEHHWLKYARQGKNFMKMPKSIDDYQNHLESTHQLIPNHRRYYGYFGNMSKEQLMQHPNTKHNQSYNGRR